MADTNIPRQPRRNFAVIQKLPIVGYLNPDSDYGFTYDGAGLTAQEVAFGKAVTAYRERFKRFPANSEMLQMAREVLSHSPP